MTFNNREEITPRFPEVSSYFAKSVLPAKPSDHGDASEPGLNLMRSAIIARESVLAAEASEDMFAEQWEVPCIPELRAIPEEAEDELSQEGMDFEPPTLDPTMADGINDTPYMLNASLQEFMPPSNLSANGGSSSDYYRLHDSFRSISSEGPNSRNYNFHDPNNVSSNLADISSSADYNENFASPQAELDRNLNMRVHLSNPPPVRDMSASSARFDAGCRGQIRSPGGSSADGGGGGGPDESSHHLRVPQSMTFRPQPPRQKSPMEMSVAVPRTPPKVKKLNFAFLEPPSPIPIRSSIAACQQYGSDTFEQYGSPHSCQESGGSGLNRGKLSMKHGLQSAAVTNLTNAAALGNAVRASVDKQGLEDFLSVLGQKRIFTELEAVEKELAPTQIPSLASVLQSEKQWLVDLNYLSESIHDESLFAHTMGNLAYISAWEINEKRCDRYSEKLNALLSRHSFDRLSYQVDLWTLNCEDRDLIMEKIQRLVKVRLNIAQNCSDRQWKHDLCGNQFSRDIVKMTLIYARQYRDSLAKYAELNRKLKSDLSDCKSIISSEIATKNSKIEILNRWKETVSYFSDVYQDLVRREEWLKQKSTEWLEEAHEIEKCVRAQNVCLIHETRKSDRLRKLIYTLNVYREKALLVDEWSLTRLSVDAAQGTVKLRLNIGVDLTTNLTNPVLLVDSTLWLHPDAVKQNSINAAMRRKVIDSRFKHLKVVDTLLLASCPWELELRLKGGALAFVKSFKIGTRDLVWGDAADRENQEVTAKNSDHRSSGRGADDSAHCANLFLQLLKVLTAALRDMLVTTFREIRHSASIDDLGGIAWCLSCSVSRLAVELMTIWHEFGAYNGDVLHYYPPPAPGTATPSSRLRFYIHREVDKAPKLTARIPVPVKNKLESLTLRFDLFAAIHGGGLYAGFEHAERLNLDELTNVRSELRRKSRDTCAGCAVSVSRLSSSHPNQLPQRVSHNTAVTDVISRLIPFMIKRSCSE